MPRPSKNLIAVAYRITKDQLDKLKWLSNEEETSQSEIIRGMINRRKLKVSSDPQHYKVKINGK